MNTALKCTALTLQWRNTVNCPHPSYLTPSRELANWKRAQRFRLFLSDCTKMRDGACNSLTNKSLCLQYLDKLIFAMKSDRRQRWAGDGKDILADTIKSFWANFCRLVTTFGRLYVRPYSAHLQTLFHKSAPIYLVLIRLKSAKWQEKS